MPVREKGRRRPGSAACTSRLTSPATRRPPPKCGAFRLQPRGSLLRQTGCWSKGDSNSPSHPERQRSEGRHMGPAHRSRFRSRAAVIVTLAALPILWTPNVVVARKVVGGFRVAIPGALLFAADGCVLAGVGV